MLTTNPNLDGGGVGNLSQPTLIEGEVQGAFELYPNPAGEALNLRFSGEILEQHQVVVTDAMGRMISEQAFRSTLDVTLLAPGVYFVNLKHSGQRIATQRFVKM